MSEFLSPTAKFKVQQHLKLGQDISPNIRKDISIDKIEISLTCTNYFLKKLQDAKERYGFSYVQVLNTQFSFLQLKDVERLDTRFRLICSKVCSSYKTKFAGGRKRESFNSNTRVIHIFKDELENVSELNFTLNKFREENIELELRCKELLDSLSSVEYSNKELVLELDSLKSQNKILADFIENKLPKDTYTNSGKGIDELKYRQQHKKIRTLETYAEKALWFAESFGIVPEKILCKSKKGKNLTLNVNSKSLKEFSDFGNLPESEKQKLRQLVFLLDKFCISDAAYHELSMSFNNMPRKHLIVQSRDDINSLYCIERLPGNMPGAYISLNSEIQRILKSKVSNGCNNFQLKFSGDGTRVSRISNFVIFSICDISDGMNLSCNELHTVGIVKCDEKYENLAKSCCPIFDELCTIANNKSIDVDGTNVTVETFVGGDMKFLQLLLGLNGSTSNYACPWCKVHKDDRFDTSKDWDFYHQNDMLRSYEELCALSNQSKKQFGVVNRPLLNLDITHYIPDELHLMMRVTDILLRNLIFDAKDNDDKMKTMSNVTTNNVSNLCEIIQTCGVAFNIWTPKGSNEFEWTSLCGTDKVKLLKFLPEKLKNSNVLNSNTQEAVTNLWIEFYQLYGFINQQECEHLDGYDVFGKTKSFVDNFLKLGSYRRGFLKCNVTPYIHCLLYHVPFFLSVHGSLYKFSGQAVEKNNDVVKLIHQRKSNKWDGPADALKVRKRIEFGQLENLERQKRSYNKTSEWWTQQIFINRSEKRQKIDEDILATHVKSQKIRQCGNSENDGIVNLESMSDSELKQLITERGIKTRIRKREKLIAILKEKMKENLK